jgi:hypothetical protein
MEIKKPTDEELHEFLMIKYIEYQLTQQQKEFNKESESRKVAFENDLRKITPQLFSRFLDAKGVSKNCTLCGSDALSVPEGGIIEGVTLPDNFDQMKTDEQSRFFQSGKVTYVGYTTLGGKSLSDLLTKTYYPMHCLNCGNLNLIRVRKVLAWVKHESAKEDQENER